MRVIFMGTSDYATIILKKLLETGIEVPLLVTQPDKPVGRKQILTPPHIKRWVEENKIDIDLYQPKTLKTKEAQEKIASYKPDFIVVAAYGQILPLDILNISTCINLHASLLPKYRGASPIQSAILNNDKFTGITAMLMEEGLDCGDILGFRFVEILDKRVDVLFEELSLAASDLCIDILRDFDNIMPIKQVDADASYCIKIKKNNGLFSFDESSLEIFTKFRAYNPWPGIYLKSGLKIKDMSYIDDANTNISKGVIIETGKNFIIVSCAVGLIKILRVQAPSKKEIGVIDYIRGKRLNIGSHLV